MNYIDKLVRFENGELEFEEVVELFQILVDTGIIFQLQGFYQRTANDLIEAGEVAL